MATSSSLHDVVWDRLQTIADIDTYDAESPVSPPTDIDGRVSAHAVLYAFAGNLMASALDGGQRCLLGSFQTTCVGGDISRTLGCVDAVRAGLPGVVTVDGVTRVIRAVEVDPGPPQPDPKWLDRYYVPLEFQLFAP